MWPTEKSSHFKKQSWQYRFHKGKEAIFTKECWLVKTVHMCRVLLDPIYWYMYTPSYNPVFLLYQSNGRVTQRWLLFINQWLYVVHSLILVNQLCSTIYIACIHMHNYITWCDFWNLLQLCEVGGWNIKLSYCLHLGQYQYLHEASILLPSTQGETICTYITAWQYSSIIQNQYINIIYNQNIIAVYNTESWAILQSHTHPWMIWLSTETLI